MINAASSPVDSESSWKRLFGAAGMLRPYRLAFVGAVLCGLVYGVASGFGLPFMSQKVFPRVFGPEPPSAAVLALVVAWLPLVFLVRNIAGFFNEYLIGYCGVRVLEDLRLRLFEKIQRLPLSILERRNRGDLLSRVMNDTNLLQETVVRASNDLVKQPVTFVGAMGALIYFATINSELVFILFSVAVIPLVVFPIRWIGRKLLKRARGMQEEMGGVTDRVSENLGAAREVRAYGLESREIARFAETSRRLVHVQLKVIQYSKVLSPTIETVASLGVAVAIFYAVRAGLGLEDVIPLVFALYMSYDPLKKIGAIHGNVSRGLAALDRIEELLAEPEPIRDRDDARPLARARGEITFDDVHFSYGEGAVLRGISCRLEAGRVYALVGPSGAGKTTFAHLVPRFYEVTGGAVRIDGIDLRDLRVADLRRNIALVPQDPVLFNESVEANIAVSRPEATPEAVRQAAHQAFADDFINGLDDGYATIAGDRGARLSGGQKQRVAIARAFLRDAPILILDEATSALDSESESQIQTALRTLVAGKTVLIIAHRLSTIDLADEILVFHEGTIAARGSHRELLADSPFYRSVWEKQQGGS